MSAAKMSCSAGHGLRTLQIVSFIPSFGLCVAASVVTQRPVPGVGLIPHAASVVFALALFYASKRRKHHHSEELYDDNDDDRIKCPSIASPLIVFVADVTLFTSFLLVLIPSFIGTDDYKYFWSPGWWVLVAYATVPLMLNACIHLFFALQLIYYSIGLHILVKKVSSVFSSSPKKCPNCHHNLRQTPRPARAGIVGHRGVEYEPLSPDSDECYHDEENGVEGPETQQTETQQTGKASK